MRQQSLIVIAVELNGRPLPGADAISARIRESNGPFTPTRSADFGTDLGRSYLDPS
jgi:hypothetical protein